MDAPFAKVVEALQEELLCINQAEVRLSSELADVTERKKKGEIALQALLAHAEAIDQPSDKSRQCAKKGDLVPIIEDLLRSNEELSVDELTGLVTDRLRDIGLSASGISRSLQAALKEPKFRTSPVDGAVSLTRRNISHAG